MYVYRNNTVERFFPKDYAFSGYDDISVVPKETDGYVWFYQLPLKCRPEIVAEEVRTYVDKLQFLLRQIDDSKPFIALTMDILFRVEYASGTHEIEKAVQDYNMSLIKFADSYPSLKVIDIRDWTRGYAADVILDWKYYFISQMGLNPHLAKDFKIWWNHKIDEIALKRKKCLVLDLDNTLWGGVLGEDGIHGIQIGGDYPGKAFLYFQEALLELSRKGVILTICSKNNLQDVLDVWSNNPFIVLKEQHFAAYKINWENKTDNIRELARELNIGLDSMVFVDDNPAERELVSQVLPMVVVPDFPKEPYELPTFFKQLVDKYFRVYAITDEDKNKTAQYKANASRVRAQEGFTDLSKFLESLEMKILIEKACEYNIQRIAQMTQKTNQFNLTTKRYTDSEIRTCIAQGWDIWCVNVSDRFGDYGITGCIFIKENDVDTFLLSCRILGKGIEIAFAKTVLNLLKNNYPKMTAHYRPSLKNMQVKDFWEKVGFNCVSHKENGDKDYEINLENSNFEIEPYYKITIAK